MYLWDKQQNCAMFNIGKESKPELLGQMLLSLLFFGGYMAVGSCSHHRFLFSPCFRKFAPNVA